LSKVTVFVPCYNEEECLFGNVCLLMQVLDKLGDSYSVVIVNDCSTDKTSREAHTLAYHFPKVTVHNYIGPKPTRREYLLISMLREESDIVVFLDCDLSTSLKDLPRLISSVKPGVIAIGNRYDTRSTVKRTFKRYLISRCLNLYTRALFRTGLQDHFIGFKAFRAADLWKILSKMNVGKNIYNPRSMWADAEMLIWAKRLGIGIKSIPVTWTESKFSRLNYKREAGIILYSLLFRVKRWIN
jgi:glycosyltransferase involved in cell wall biosynthesis